jgi:recombinational DNA repair protein (RecF pathway)
MLEHYTTAIVLKVDPRAEVDAAVTLYTKDLGKLTAKAKSLKKITSKLAGHLVPGNIVKIRFIERGDGGGMQVLDAMSEKPAGDPAAMLRFMIFLDRMSLAGLPDPGLWHEAEQAIKMGDFSPLRHRRILKALGFGESTPACEECGKKGAVYFLPREVIFLCANSLAKLNISDEDAFQV